MELGFSKENDGRSLIYYIVIYGEIGGFWLGKCVKNEFSKEFDCERVVLGVNYSK